MSTLHSDRIGIASEAMVEQALKTLITERSKFPEIPVKQFVHAEKHSRLDRNHIDFLITLLTGDQIPIQVKSSVKHAARFHRHGRRKGYFIPTVVVTVGEKIESVINKVVGCIRLMLNRLRRRANWRTHLRRTRHTTASRRVRCTGGINCINNVMACTMH